MRIYTADNNRNIFDKILEEVAEESIDNSRNFILLVPEKLSLTMEREILLKHKRKALINVQVLTLSRMLRKMLKSSDNYLPKESGIMIVKKLIMENMDSLVCFNKTAKTIGFAERIYDTISNLKNSNVRPEDFKLKITKVNESLRIKMQDILLLYTKYEEYIKRNGMIDACDRFILLSRMVEESEMIKNSECYVFGFDNISASGMEVLKSVIRCSKKCTFGCLNNTGKSNSYIIEPEMLESVKNASEELNIIPTIVEIVSKEKSVTSHIRNNLFAYPYQKMQIGNEVVLIECKSPLEEVQFVAEIIRRNVIKKGLRYNDFAVACSDLDVYGDAVKSVFKDYHLPYFVDKSECLNSHPLIMFINAVLVCYKRHISSDELLKVVKNYFSGVDKIKQNELENYIVKYGVNYEKFKKPFEYGRLNRNNEVIESYVLAESARADIMSKLELVFELLEKARTSKSFTFAINEIFEIFKLDELTEQFIDELIENKEKLMVDFTRQVKQKFMNIVSEIERIMGDSLIDFDEYYSILQAGLTSETVSLIPVFVDSVFIGDASSSKFLGSKYLFVIGASEGAIPKSVEDCGIIVDKEIQALTDTVGKKIEPTIRTINRRERFKFISLLQSFKEKLYVIYPKYDKDSSEQKPSLALLDIAKIFYKIDITTPLDIIPMNSYRRKRGLFNEDDRSLNYAYEFSTKEVGMRKLLSQAYGGAMSDNNEMISALYWYFRKNLNNEKFLLPKSKNNKLASPKTLFFPNKTTSISQLECYFSCPYKFFANYGLGIKEREESRLKSIDFGNVLHRIAELYVKGIEKYRKIKDVHKRETILNNLIDRVFDEEKIKTASNRHIVLPLKGEAKRLIDALTFQYELSNYKPIAEELVFGEKGKVKGLELGGGIKLEGKIDRVDTFGDNFRVVDYKTGKIDLQAKNVYYGNKIQLFMYLNALKDTKKTPSGAFYLPIKNVFVDEDYGTFLYTYKMQGYFVDDISVARNMDIGLNKENTVSNIIGVSLKEDKQNLESDNLVIKKQNHILSTDILDGVMNYTMELSRGAIKEILSGNIEMSPIQSGEKPVCEYCAYKNICGLMYSSAKKARKTKQVSFEDFAITKEDKLNNGED
ncbi:MAG: exodeoxyribonuclease V subunit gamma [Clostridia bacterium]|nr:exodeoxyribonuclease V subunit gamma [Clostridia bacterium]